MLPGGFSLGVRPLPRQARGPTISKGGFETTPTKSHWFEALLIARIDQAEFGAAVDGATRGGRVVRDGAILAVADGLQSVEAIPRDTKYNFTELARFWDRLRL